MRALDLFAGTGWGVACQRLGIAEQGVEIAPASVATREANGMSTLYRDVWEGLDHDPLDYDILIASPPCQTFSMAGNGAGRRALDEVIEAISLGAYRDPAALRDFGERHDPRTALVLTPLAHVYRDAPLYVVMEQVPTVLPVWEAVAEVMRTWGYSVVTGNLQAEMYGVPQTRKRAILIARADGVEAAMPTPTHSRYYPRDPSRLDAGVKPWVSMAEALGWGMTDKPLHTITGGTHGAPDEFLSGGDSWVMRSNYQTGHGENAGKKGERTSAQPAPTMTSKADRNKWTARPATTVAGDPRIPAPGHHERQMNNATRVTIEEAAALQSYPAGFTFVGTNSARYLHIGNAVPPLLAEAILSTLL